MDFSLEPEFELLKQTAKKIAKEKVLPRAREIDQTGQYPEDLFQVFKSAGFLGLCIPEKYGGSGAGIFGLTLAIEEVAKYSNACALMLLLTRLPTGPILIGGSEDQKRRYLPGIASGELRAAFGLSEPTAGSDVAGMKTRAEKDPKNSGGYILNGIKCWMSGICQADYYIVFAKEGDPVSRDHKLIKAFIVRRELQGVSIGRVDSKMGVKGVDTGELILENVRIEKEDVIPSDGFKLAMLSLNSMRPIVAARGIGLAEGALMYAVEYLKQREGFGGLMIDFQGLQWEIAKLATEIEAARLLTYRAAKLSDQGCYTKEHVPFLSMAKYYATEVAVKASSMAVQFLGAAGYMTEQLTELYYRDAKQLTIVEGTSQIQLGLIANGVVDGDLWWD